MSRWRRRMQKLCVSSTGAIWQLHVFTTCCWSWLWRLERLKSWSTSPLQRYSRTHYVNCHVSTSCSSNWSMYPLITHRHCETLEVHLTARLTRAMPCCCCSSLHQRCRLAIVFLLYRFNRWQWLLVLFEAQELSFKLHLWIKHTHTHTTVAKGIVILVMSNSENRDFGNVKLWEPPSTAGRHKPINGLISWQLLEEQRFLYTAKKTKKTRALNWTVRRALNASAMCFWCNELLAVRVLQTKNQKSSGRVC